MSAKSEQEKQTIEKRLEKFREKKKKEKEKEERKKKIWDTLKGLVPSVQLQGIRFRGRQEQQGEEEEKEEQEEEEEVNKHSSLIDGLDLENYT